jgi:SAM-dependent methyltransferase
MAGMAAEYRWNLTDLARGYDAAAEHVHPHYLEIQDAILELLSPSLQGGGLVVDAGGGSGRLAERLLSRSPRCRVALLDQSEPFLGLAERRLEKFPGRFDLQLCRLQDDWTGLLTEAPAAIVSMSAVHHLDPAEKRSFYRRCHDVLRPGGWCINGDEVRAGDDEAYLRQVTEWSQHMDRVMAAGLVSEPMCAALRGWQQRNVAGFGGPRQSGDDCHETAEAQLGYLRDAGFAEAFVPWQRGMWAVLCATKPPFRGAKGDNQV